jgi:O-antigen ligase
MKMIPDHLWLGRGFGQDALGDYSLFWDPTQVQYHVNQGRFFNGMVGLLVNTGLLGTFMMLLFLFSGTLLAFKVMRILREYGCEDDFARIASIITGLWMANAIGFILLHGDSEYAMKTFSLQAGLLLICHYHLEKRHHAS